MERRACLASVQTRTAPACRVNWHNAIMERRACLASVQTRTAPACRVDRHQWISWSGELASPSVQTRTFCSNPRLCAPHAAPACRVNRHNAIMERQACLASVQTRTAPACRVDRHQWISWSGELASPSVQTRAFCSNPRLLFKPAPVCSTRRSGMSCQ